MKFAVLLVIQCMLSIGLTCDYNSAKASNDAGDFGVAKTKIYGDRIDGYHGIWYANQALKNKYVYKYSGGLGTYCAKHSPFAVYSAKVNKTFFCYGGTNAENSTLYHMVSYFDHATGKVPQPVRLIDKKTADAHDNPVMSIDKNGIIWIFSTSHGVDRPSYVFRSKHPYDTGGFEQVFPTRKENGQTVPMNNFSYFQVYNDSHNRFLAFYTRYYVAGVNRAIGFSTSRDGVSWDEWKPLALIDEGHYQVSEVQGTVMATAFNFHPQKGGLNSRTNLYYLQSKDYGKTWTNIQGEVIKTPVKKEKNSSLIRDFREEKLKVYLKDMVFTREGFPLILIITSKGFKAGPKNGPRTWRTVYWDGKTWKINTVTTSDNNYDMGSIYIEDDGSWTIIGPTEPGPQLYNPGGEISVWNSVDRGGRWRKIKQKTKESKYNHTYVRRPVNAHPEFYSFWADGHGREISKSRLYFSNKAGKVFRLPEKMNGDFAIPESL